MRRLFTSAAVVLVGILAASCSSASSGAPRVSSSSTSRVPLPAGASPSEISKMVCSTKNQGEIANTLGVAAQVQPATWANHVYACRFLYGSNASLNLSVKELSSWAQTYSYFDTLRSQLGSTGSLNGLGQGAFQTNAGDVVVRKDYKVLLVDISGLPPQFGNPATPSSDVAVTVADVILGCWNGD